MGLIRAAISSAKDSIRGGFLDQTLDAYEAVGLSDETVFVKGSLVRGGGRNTRRGIDNDIVPNGSLVHVGENQFMMLVDGGKIIDFTAESGYYTVDNSSAPSMFSGSFGDALQEVFNRFRFGGASPVRQQVFYLNLQEIKNIPFGTPNPINYFDNFYNAELFLRAFGYYSVKITDPILFYAEALPKDRARVDFKDIQELYLSEFLTAFQTALGTMSADGVRISHLSGKTMQLAKYMSEVLDEDWNAARGMQIQSVGIKSLSYDEESKRLINMRNQGAMMGDAAVREGYVQSAVADGIRSAGRNANGAVNGFMGVGLGMQSAGGFMSAASASNRAQMERQEAAAAEAKASGQWSCPQCGHKNTGKFCSECGTAKPTAGWTCPSCGTVNEGKFCSECGTPRPQTMICPKCGRKLETPAKFCPECGQKLS